MADPRGINPPVPHLDAPSPTAGTLSNEDHKRLEDGPFDVNTLGTDGVNSLGAAGLMKFANSTPDTGGKIVDGGWGTDRPGHMIPRNLTGGVQKAVRELNLPPETAMVVGSGHPDINPNRLRFNIPGQGGQWALSVDRKYVGAGQGQVSTERWANVAKILRKQHRWYLFLRQALKNRIH